MIALTDMVGDEDDAALHVEYLKQLLQKSILDRLTNIKPISWEEATKVLEAQYTKVLTDTHRLQGYGPQVKCELQQDGKIKVNFLCPQWMADRINEDD